jgi:hypothetical protein
VTRVRLSDEERRIKRREAERHRRKRGLLFWRALADVQAEVERDRPAVEAAYNAGVAGADVALSNLDEAREIYEAIEAACIRGVLLGKPLDELLAALTAHCKLANEQLVAMLDAAARLT